MPRPVVHPPGLLFERGLSLARELHGGDAGKQDAPVACVSDPLAVSALILQDGGSEIEAVAGLLHGCAGGNDGQQMLERVQAALGVEVREIVATCREPLVDARGWRQHKKRHIAALADAEAAVLRVANADALHRARAIVAGYRTHGEEFWPRLSPQSGSDQLWYFKSLAGVFAGKRDGSVLAQELDAAVRTLDVLIAGDGLRGHLDWLGDAIQHTRRFADAMLDDFELERSWTRFGSDDYDWLLLERDAGENARTTLAQLERERDAYKSAIASHHQDWPSE